MGLECLICISNRVVSSAIWEKTCASDFFKDDSGSGSQILNLYKY